MKIERVLTTLEEYLDLRREISAQGGDHHVVNAAKQRAEMALNEYIGGRFNHLMVEERTISSDDRKLSTNPTRKVEVVNPANASIAWDEVVGLIDALNCPPTPLRDQSNQKSVERWMAAYNEWYLGKRRVALRVNPIGALELDLDGEL